MNRSPIRLSPVEKITLCYICITAVYSCCFAGRLSCPYMHLGVRAAAAAFILLTAWCEARKLFSAWRPATAAIRYIFPFAMLSYWYPETYYYNELIFSNLDSYFVAADQALFGCQPSLEFSRQAPHPWVSELMYFGYFSYFFIFFGTALLCYLRRKETADRAAFLFVGSFFCYYFVFIVFPVTGPQFYFAPPLNEVPDGYLFCDVMRFLQATAEKPTGAFPSSHVGVTFIVIMFIYRHFRRLLPWALPLFVVLVCSTVYIKAHYVIDVMGGFVSAALIYPLLNRLYRIIDS
ncbi:MAG: phosphatase PAP2 family protein [Bacteroidales bacterium]|jgi:membrane-associated phospholipid phosphatase|nr:phosphatase PAP2 family protein [Bacteroidales bacterium]